MALTKEDLQAIEQLLDKFYSEKLDPRFTIIEDNVEKLRKDFESIYRLDPNELKVATD